MEGVSVQSAGLSAYEGEAPSDYAIEALREVSIDISGHRSRRVVMEDLMEADCIYVMTPQHRDVVLDAVPEMSRKITVMGIADPSGQELKMCIRDSMGGTALRFLDDWNHPF